MNRQITFSVGFDDLTGRYTVVRTEKRIMTTWATRPAAEAEAEACRRASAEVDAAEAQARI